MSKSFPLERKGEGVGDIETQVLTHVIKPQTASKTNPGLPVTRPALALHTPTQQKFIVQTHHEMKNHGKATRPIAPAPPSQVFQSISTRTVTQANNIPSILTPSAPASDTTASSMTGGTAVNPGPISVPVTLSQASVLTLTNPTSLGSTATIVQQGLQGNPLSLNMLRAPLAGQQAQSQMQALQNLTQFNRSTSTLAVPKAPALLRQPSTAAATATLHMPGGLPPTLSLPLARAPLLQNIKTTTAQIARPISPAVGVQAQDLSRSSFPIHGSITPTGQGPHGMHILNQRMVAPQTIAVGGASLSQQDNSNSSSNTGILTGPAVVATGGIRNQLVVPMVTTTIGSSSYPPSSSSSILTSLSQNTETVQHQQQRVASAQDAVPSSSAGLGGGVHHHIHHPLNNPHHHHSQQQQHHQLGRSTLPFSGPHSSPLLSMTSNKLGPHQGLVQPAKVIPSHALQQQGVSSSIKSVNLAVPSPVMINSINPAAIPSCTASSIASIPIAKIPPQRQHVAVSIPHVSANIHIAQPLSSTSSAPSSLPLSISTPSATASSVSTLPTAMAITSLPTSFTLPHSSLSSSGSFMAAGLSSLATMASPANKQDHAGLNMIQSSNGGIIITSEFQGRASGTILPMTSMVSSSHSNSAPSTVSHADNRQLGIGPKDSMWYQHYLYQHVSQAPLVTQQGGPTIVGPNQNTFAFLPTTGKVQNQSNPLAALPVSSAPTNLRFGATAGPGGMAGGGTMMVVDPLRQPHHHNQHPPGVVLHPAFGGAALHGNLVAEKLANLSSRPPQVAPSCTGNNSFTASVGVQSQMGSSGASSHLSNLQSGGLSAVPVSNPSSSPRPSILRKRTSDIAGVMVRKPNFNLNQDHRCNSPIKADSATTAHNTSTTTSSVCSPTPKISKNFSPMSENSQSSTDTALSSNDAATPTNNHIDKSKVETEENIENGPTQNSTMNNIPASPAVSHTGSLSEASPRKRARKQSLHANEELKDNSSSEDEMETPALKKVDKVSKEQRQRDEEIEKTGEFVDEEGVRWVLHKPKPTFVLLQPDNINVKTRNNHFVKHSEVKPKEDRHPTVNELSNQKGIMQKVNGWRLYFSASQLEELVEFEKEMQAQFRDVQTDLAKVTPHRSANDEVLSKIHEISQANIQRCELIQTQVNEARATMLRTLEHQPRIHQIVNKHMSKRPIKKKERT